MDCEKKIRMENNNNNTNDTHQNHTCVCPVCESVYECFVVAIVYLRDLLLMFNYDCYEPMQTIFAIAIVRQIRRRKWGGALNGIRGI